MQNKRLPAMETGIYLNQPEFAYFVEFDHIVRVVHLAASVEILLDFDI
jgi:hypothetical protein